MKLKENILTPMKKAAKVALPAIALGLTACSDAGVEDTTFDKVSSVNSTPTTSNTDSNTEIYSFNGPVRVDGGHGYIDSVIIGSCDSTTEDVKVLLGAAYDGDSESQIGATGPSGLDFTNQCLDVSVNGVKNSDKASELYRIPQDADGNFTLNEEVALSQMYAGLAANDTFNPIFGTSGEPTAATKKRILDNVFRLIKADELDAIDEKMTVVQYLTEQAGSTNLTTADGINNLISTYYQVPTTGDEREQLATIIQKLAADATITFGEGSSLLEVFNQGGAAAVLANIDAIQAGTYEVPKPESVTATVNGTSIVVTAAEVINGEVFDGETSLGVQNLPYTIENATEGEHTISVKGVSDDARSEAVAAAAVTVEAAQTTPEAPGVPTDPAATVDGSTITITATIPEGATADIEGIGSVTLPHTVTGAPAGEHTFNVRSTNANGQSEYVATYAVTVEAVVVPTGNGRSAEAPLADEGTYTVDANDEASTIDAYFQGVGYIQNLYPTNGAEVTMCQANADKECVNENDLYVIDHGTSKYVKFDVAAGTYLVEQKEYADGGKEAGFSGKFVKTYVTVN